MPSAIAVSSPSPASSGTFNGAAVAPFSEAVAVEVIEKDAPDAV